ncbi:MAG: 30S ribosomal protein S5 [Candidatus Saccharimonadales bacterium]
MAFGQARRRPETEEDKRFDEQMLHIDRVARVVKGGRRFRFRALVVVGDHKANVGIGIAKGSDVTAAVTKANEVAKKNMIKVPLYKETIPHDVEAKVGGSRILLMPASAGTGLIAGGVVRTILEVAGVGNVLSKSLGSSNKANTAYATIAALKQLKPESEWTTRIGTFKPKSDVKVTSTTSQPKSEAKVNPSVVKSKAKSPKKV